MCALQSTRQTPACTSTKGTTTAQLPDAWMQSTIYRYHHITIAFSKHHAAATVRIIGRITSRYDKDSSFTAKTTHAKSETATPGHNPQVYTGSTPASRPARSQERKTGKGKKKKEKMRRKKKRRKRRKKAGYTGASYSLATGRDTTWALQVQTQLPPSLRPEYTVFPTQTPGQNEPPQDRLNPFFFFQKREKKKGGKTSPMQGPDQ